MSRYGCDRHGKWVCYRHRATGSDILLSGKREKLISVKDFFYWEMDTGLKKEIFEENLLG